MDKLCEKNMLPLATVASVSVAAEHYANVKFKQGMNGLCLATNVSCTYLILFFVLFCVVQLFEFNFFTLHVNTH